MFNILSAISKKFSPKNRSLFHHSITDSEQNIYIPSHNELLKDLNDESKGDLSDEKDSILLQSLQQDTLHFVSASVIGNQRAYQNIIFFQND
jgi:DNA-binding MarR family transcriptional regulator